MVRTKFLIFTILTSVLLVGATLISGQVKADQFDTQIQALKEQNAANQAVANSLAATAASYQQAVDALNAKIDSLQSAIVATQNQIDSLQKQIDVAQAELDHEKLVLGENIKTMYLEGDVSTLEVLASSKNLSDFVNKQEYRNSVSNKIKGSVEKIDSLKAQLQSKQHQQQDLLKDQQSQQSQLQADESQQAQLLGYTEGQKATYDAQIKNNNAQIASLRAQQAAAYAAYLRRGGITSYGVGEAGNGGYPSEWANAYQDTRLDSWGMYNRECVSYVAWKVDSTGHHMPYWGSEDANAYNWINLANSYHIPNGTDPQSGAVVVWGHNDGMGWLGHVAYVESVNSDGSIEVSQYNVIHGQFSRMHVDTGTAQSLHYIYF